MADQPWQTALYTAHSPDYRSGVLQWLMAMVIFRTAHKWTPTLRAKTAQNFLTYTRQYIAQKNGIQCPTSAITESVV